MRISKETMMMQMRIAVMAGTFLLAGTAFAAAPDFGMLDRDGNGYIERAEIESAAPEVLRKNDRNGDGHLDRKEFEAAGGVPSRFDLLDKNKNGLIDLNELKKIAESRFKEFDTNRDGRIDTNEWDKLRKLSTRPVIVLFYF